MYLDNAASKVVELVDLDVIHQWIIDTGGNKPHGDWPKLFTQILNYKHRYSKQGLLTNCDISFMLVQVTFF